MFCSSFTFSMERQIACCWNQYWPQAHRSGWQTIKGHQKRKCDTAQRKWRSCRDSYRKTLQISLVSCGYYWYTSTHLERKGVPDHGCGKENLEKKAEGDVLSGSKRTEESRACSLSWRTESLEKQWCYQPHTAVVDTDSCFWLSSCTLKCKSYTLNWSWRASFVLMLKSLCNMQRKL